MVLDLLNVRAWAMESRFFERAVPVVVRAIEQGHEISTLFKPSAGLMPSVEYLEDPYRVTNPLMGAKTTKGAMVAYIPITGGLSKNGGLCSLGMSHHINQIQKANRREDVKAILLVMDTPGGSVDGTPELATSIRESAKPVVVFADGMVASAGYWAASQAAEIVANANNYTEIGSIGTLFVYPNYANVIEAGNFPNVKIIRAPQSKDKAMVNSFEPLTAEKEREVLADLKQITEDFKAVVMAGRGDRLQTGEEDIFTGKMYDKSIAQKMGMIDAIGSRQDAIDRAGELADSKEIPDQVRDDDKKTGPAASGRNNKSSMKFPKISSLFGKAESEVKEELSAEEQASLEAAEQKLTEQETTLAERATRISELEAQVNTLSEEKAEEEGKVKTLEATVAEQKAELDKKPDGQATTVVAAEDEFKDDKQFLTSVDKQKAELNAE